MWRSPHRQAMRHRRAPPFLDDIYIRSTAYDGAIMTKKIKNLRGKSKQDELSFTPIYHHLKGFKLIERAIYGEIKMRSDHFRDRKCTASHSTIAKNIGAGVRSVERAIPEMILKGMIKVVFQGASKGIPNHYIACDILRQIGTPPSAKLVPTPHQFGGQEEEENKSKKKSTHKSKNNKLKLPKVSKRIAKIAPLVQDPPPVAPPPSRPDYVQYIQAGKTQWQYQDDLELYLDAHPE